MLNRDAKAPKKVMAMHDMCGYGRSSLTAVFPALSVLNCQVCPLPTALLSSHLGFANPSILNLSDELKKFLHQWQNLGLHFDSFYSGYLASPDQVEIAKQYIHTFQPKFIFVDPVLGDNGQLYHGFDERQVVAMRELFAIAHVVSPNMTEACLLLGEPPVISLPDLAVHDYLKRLAMMGPSKVCITGVPSADGLTLTTYGYDHDKKLLYQIATPRILRDLHGTGDSLASAMLGMMLQGYGFNQAIARAVSYVQRAAQLAQQFDSELCLEPALHVLINHSESVGYVEERHVWN
jgi:pyridoxine kinase